MEREEKESKRAREDRRKVEKIRKGGGIEEEKDGKNIGRKEREEEGWRTEGWSESRVKG